MYLGRGQNIRKNHTHLFRKNIKDLIESIDCTVESESKEQEKEKIISNEVSENGEGLDPRWLVDPRDEPVWVCFVELYASLFRFIIIDR